MAAGFSQPIAGTPKILVPSFREASDDLLRGLPGDFHAGVDDVSPGVYPGAFFGMFFEADPLRQNYTKRVVDPSDFVRGLAIRDDVAHHGLYRLENFYIQAGSPFPCPAFAPLCLSPNFAQYFTVPPLPCTFHA